MDREGRIVSYVRRAEIADDGDHAVGIAVEFYAGAGRHADAFEEVNGVAQGIDHQGLSHMNLATKNSGDGRLMRAVDSARCAMLSPPISLRA